MGQLGFQEIFLIFLIALLVFGPRKLPELGKSLGKGLREFRRATDDLKSSWNEQMRDVENPLKDVTEELNKDFQDTAREIQQDIYASTEPTPETQHPESTQPTETAAVSEEKEKV